MTPNFAAFLSLIRYSEGTALAADPYRVCYGYKHTIVDMSDHPYFTGEWKGEILPDHMCIAAGMQPGCKSTAAGAYQINHATWARLKAKLKLASFNNAAQDDAALDDVSSVGGLALINAGRIPEAIQACRAIWASLPGNTAGQPQRSMADLLDHFSNAGGMLA